MTESLLKIPPDAELLEAARHEITSNQLLEKKITEYRKGLQSRIQNMDEDIKKNVKMLVEESKSEIAKIEEERIDTIKQLTDLQDIRIKLEEAIQRKEQLKLRTETELKRGRKLVLAQKKNQDVSEAFLCELEDELEKIQSQLTGLIRDDQKIQIDIGKLYQAKELLEYVLDAKKTQNIIDAELLNARHNFELVEPTQNF